MAETLTASISLLLVETSCILVAHEGEERIYITTYTYKTFIIMDDSLSVQPTNGTSWYAMRVFMNKVPFCRDMFNIFNNVLLGIQAPKDDFPKDLQGEAMEYFAPFYIDTFTNAKGKRVEVERPLVPSLFFMRSNKRQAEGFERELMGTARLYRRHTYGRQPIQIPLKQMQMFMMVTSGGREGLEFFEDGAFSWQKGERVRVIDGKFKGLEGEIKRIKGDHRLVVAVEGVCAVATAYIPRCFLERILKY